MGKLFSQGWDAFWLDSAEPEEYWPHMGDAILRDKQLAIGSGARYTNIFPLMHTNGIQEHWKETTDQKRVFLLTRSAFAGPAAGRGDSVVRRCLQHVLGTEPSGGRRPELRALGSPLLDDGHWRILAAL